ncbi:MAG: hypothetical protein EPO11_06445 [Gammaproteobacteria bacterium]|nr:MAG: hypothetical protein EPO11_06445 [Gammaproteobacteria bacterium]
MTISRKSLILNKNALANKYIGRLKGAEITKEGIVTLTREICSPQRIYRRDSKKEISENNCTKGDVMREFLSFIGPVRLKFIDSQRLTYEELYNLNNRLFDFESDKTTHSIFREEGLVKASMLYEYGLYSTYIEDLQIDTNQLEIIKVDNIPVIVNSKLAIADKTIEYVKQILLNFSLADSIPDVFRAYFLSFTEKKSGSDDVKVLSDIFIFNLFQSLLIDKMSRLQGVADDMINAFIAAIDILRTKDKEFSEQFRENILNQLNRPFELKWPVQINLETYFNDEFKGLDDGLNDSQKQDLQSLKNELGEKIKKNPSELVKQEIYDCINSTKDLICKYNAAMSEIRTSGNQQEIAARFIKETKQYESNYAKLSLGPKIITAGCSLVDGMVAAVAVAAVSFLVVSLILGPIGGIVTAAILGTICGVAAAKATNKNVKNLFFSSAERSVNQLASGLKEKIKQETAVDRGENVISCPRVLC